jgi:hypothetical protein
VNAVADGRPLFPAQTVRLLLEQRHALTVVVSAMAARRAKGLVEAFFFHTY